MGLILFIWEWGLENFVIDFKFFVLFIIVVVLEVNILVGVRMVKYVILVSIYIIVINGIDILMVWGRFL